MSLFRFLWLRRIVRRHTKPIPHNTAEVWQRRLSLIYMFLAWNAVGVVALAVYNGRSDWAKYHGLPQQEGSSAQQWTHILGLTKVKVVKISGTKVDTYEIENDFDRQGNVLESKVIKNDE